VTCGNGGTVRLCDPPDGTARELLTGAPADITSARFGPDASRIAVVGPGTVRFLQLDWELEAP
jgi:hypothetical protein